MRDGIPVLRPKRKTEYEVFFVSKSVEKQWLKLLATRRNQLVDAWETLTKHPFETTPSNYRLKGDLGSITKSGEQFELWQLKLNEREGARIWYFESGGNVFIEEIHTSHPNQTK